MSSRLFQEIREKRGLAYAVNSFTSAYNDCGIFAIYTGTAAKDAQAIIPPCEEIKICLRHLHNAELNRAKAQFKSTLLMGLENTSTRCGPLRSKPLLLAKHAIDQMIENITMSASKILAGLRKRFCKRANGDRTWTNFTWTPMTKLLLRFAA